MLLPQLRERDADAPLFCQQSDAATEKVGKADCLGQNHHQIVAVHYEKRWCLALCNCYSGWLTDTVEGDEDPASEPLSTASKISPLASQPRRASACVGLSAAVSIRE